MENITANIGALSLKGMTSGYHNIKAKTPRYKVIGDDRSDAVGSYSRSRVFVGSIVESHSISGVHTHGQPGATVSAFFCSFLCSFLCILFYRVFGKDRDG